MTTSGSARRLRKILLAGASGIALACWLPGAASAATYFVGNQVQLTAAINAANADGDASSSIVMTQSFSVLAPVNLPTPTKSLSIDTQGFTLSGTGSPGNPGSIVFRGGTFTSGTVSISGTLVGGNQAPTPPTSVAAGVGLTFDSGVTTVGGTTGQVVNNGSITGGAATATSNGGIGVSLLNVVTFVNNGTVSGGIGVNGPPLGNNGAGVNILNTGATVINTASGTIQGGNSQGGYAGAGIFAAGTAAKPGTVVNYGTIRGGSDLTGVGTGNFAIRQRGLGVSITNYGTLEGGNGVAAIGPDANSATTITIVNSGTIRGGTGSTTAMQFANNIASRATLELQAGSQIIGNVIASIPGTNDILRLGGSTDSSFDVSSIGTQYQNFDSFEKTGTSTWKLTGTGTATTNWTIQQGTLQIGDGGISGSMIGNVVNSGTLAFDRSDQVIFAGTISGTGGVNQIGTGTTVLTGANTYSGATTITAGKLSVNGSLANSAVTILNGGALGGNGMVGATTLQAGGVIAPGNSIGTLTIQGNYIGAGGTVEIEAMLDGDASSADRLVITGDTIGTTNVKVIALGGGGAQTTDGIKIVDVGGTSAGTFNLQGDYVFQGDQAVVVGAYAYRLYHNGISTPADGDWYLRSSLISPDDPNPPVDPSPLYAPTVPVYEAYAGVLQSFNQLGTLQQRVGNRSWTGAPQSAEDDNVAGGSPIWGRIEAAHSEFDPGTTTTGTNYDANLWRLQAGLDGLLWETNEGALIGGVTVHYGNVKSDVSSPFGVGSIDTTGYGFGGTLTWHGRNGFYVDTQAELTWFNSDLASATLGRTLVDGNNGFGYGLGIEAGRKIAIQGNWSLTPQAQLSYSSVDFDTFTDPYGALVSNARSDTLISRLGLSADHENEWKDTTGQHSRSHAYTIANLYYDFLNGSGVDVSGVRLASEPQALWGGLGLGGSLSWADDRYSVHGELLARTSLQDFGDSQAFGGSVGFKVRW
ncbi:MAG: autotransporter outer membrane beta-barrel domain-containing protein [Mesorhizobium sp.]